MLKSHCGDISTCGCEKSSGPIERFMGKRSWDLEQHTKSIFLILRYRKENAPEFVQLLITSQYPMSTQFSQSDPLLVKTLRNPQIHCLY